MVRLLHPRLLSWRNWIVVCEMQCAHLELNDLIADEAEQTLQGQLNDDAPNLIGAQLGGLEAACEEDDIDDVPRGSIVGSDSNDF